MFSDKKFFAYINISRPLNSLITFLVIIVASIISIDGRYSVLKIILAGLSGALTASAGNVINDYFDIDIDKINKPPRVLPQGKLSLKEALSFYFFLTVLSLVISSFININAFTIVFIASLFLFFYSNQLKKISLLGNIVVSTLTALTFIYGGIAVDNIKDAIIPAVFAFLINFIREIVKDMEDIEGDKLQGINSFPAVHGFKKAKTIIVFITIVLIILTVFPFVTKLYAIEYFIVVMVFVNPLLVYIVKSLFEDDSIKNLNKLSNLLKLNMVIGLTAIFLGK
jgi:geranylgeranylglycerol-phosphate geranylgeranyltransferase